jgi:hypothetical protein
MRVLLAGPEFESNPRLTLASLRAAGHEPIVALFNAGTTPRPSSAPREAPMRSGCPCFQVRRSVLPPLTR